MPTLVLPPESPPSHKTYSVQRYSIAEFLALELADGFIRTYQRQYHAKKQALRPNTKHNLSNRLIRMKTTYLFVFLFAIFQHGMSQNYIFFLHNKFTEEHHADEKHPAYGKAQYNEIIREFERENFILITEKRPKNTVVKEYAKKVAGQIDSLLQSGIKPNQITVIGLSKGGYIAQYVSTLLANPNINFVFIGSYQETDLKQLSDISYCGNILTIYEKTDILGVSAVNRTKNSKFKISRFDEIELNTNLKHGFLFQPLKEWIYPSMMWANQNYKALNRFKKDYQISLQSKVYLDTLTLYDTTRLRKIPVAYYSKKNYKKSKKQQIVIFSHGYGQNKGGDYLAYSYLTEYLASQNLFVASIQHELPTDSLLPSTGIPQIVRRPCWERGADNILFVINELKKSYPNLNFAKITLIGHSNGGDMTALFPQKYPQIVNKIITLDNRRMALPKATNLRVYSLRSTDQLADEGVLPNEKEKKEFKMRLIKLPNTTHDQMDDNANEKQRAEIRSYILKFIQE